MSSPFVRWSASIALGSLAADGSTLLTWSSDGTPRRWSVDGAD